MIQWTAEPTLREPLHAEVHVGGRKADGEDAAELVRAEQEKEKRQKEAAAEGLDMLGDGRDRKDMLQRWAQRLRGKVSTWQNVLMENGEAQPGLEERIEGCRREQGKVTNEGQTAGDGGEVQARMHAGQVPVQAGWTARAQGWIP